VRRRASQKQGVRGKKKGRPPFSARRKNPLRPSSEEDTPRVEKRGKKTRRSDTKRRGTGVFLADGGIWLKFRGESGEIRRRNAGPGPAGRKKKAPKAMRKDQDLLSVGIGERKKKKDVRPVGRRKKARPALRVKRTTDSTFKVHRKRG